MRKYILGGFFILGVIAIIFAPDTIWGQGGGGGKKGGKGFSSDPKEQFDRMAKGQPYILISEMKFGRNEMITFAQQRGITNGQISFPQYLEFKEQMKANGGGGPGFKMGGGQTPGQITVTPQNPDLIYQMADSEFKRRDKNGDGILNPDEMPSALRDKLDKWDTNRDGFIDQTEFRAFFAARLVGGDQDGSKPGAVTTIIVEEEEDWDRKTVVLRAGKLPKDGLPSWFNELDADKDGQVALYEWRKGSEPLEQFHEWDLDGDGFITPEEAMKVYAKTHTPKDGTITVALGNRSPGEGGRPQFGKGPGGGGGRPPGGGGGMDWSKFTGKGKKDRSEK